MKKKNRRKKKKKKKRRRRNFKDSKRARTESELQTRIYNNIVGTWSPNVTRE